MFPSIRADAGVHAHSRTSYGCNPSIREKRRDAVDRKGRRGLSVLRDCCPEDDIGDGRNRDTHAMRPVLSAERAWLARRASERGCVTTSEWIDDRSDLLEY